MHDGLTLEDKGVPTAVIISDQFVSGVKEIAKSRGAPDYPYVVVKHPIGSLDEETLKERARDALPQVLDILLNGNK
ncbi:MAG: hypothetical protein ACE5KI_04265 [Dehalococcoidia bacterium]